MCFGTVEYPWDDRLAMRAALLDVLGRPGEVEAPVLPTAGTDEGRPTSVWETTDG
jgi:hypothetical protein